MAGWGIVTAVARQSINHLDSIEPKRTSRASWAFFGQASRSCGLVWNPQIVSRILRWVDKHPLVLGL